jgi:GNAT superfamily N-acetyltransferase
VPADPAVVLRPAVPADVPRILAFIRELATYERAPDEVVGTEDLLHEALFGPRPDAEVVLAELDGAPVGFALFCGHFSTWLTRRGLWLEDLYVTPSARGRGIGRALLQHLARIAVERGCGRLEWWVLDWNAPAIGFYQGLGAVPMSEWTVWRLSGDALSALNAGGTGPPAS